MCVTCGCSEAVNEPGVPEPGIESGFSEHVHKSDHEHVQPHSHSVTLEEALLSHNETIAAQNRTWFESIPLFAINLLSSPGAGKTTLLETTLTQLLSEVPCAVIEGDQATAHDAERIKATGAPAAQINTGKGCHLEADMVHKAAHSLPLAPGSLLFIENVGNLVCPALFDLGEACKVVVLSVTEGADKPLKYPHMFRAADVVLINKMDLLPYVDFDLTACERWIREINPAAKTLKIAANKPEQMGEWLNWLKSQLLARKNCT